MADIKDVAKLANVSVTTVSRVLNNKGYVGVKTLSAVRRAMEELDYPPNEMARAFYRQHSYLLGLIVPNAAHPFFAEIIRHVEQFAYERGYKVLVCGSLMEAEKEKGYIEMLKARQVDGIIMASQTIKVENYRDLALPIVPIDRNLSDDIPFIAADNYQGGLLATRHLLECGCRELVHITGSLNIRMKSNERSQALWRLARRPR